ncbi:MAG: hypothetical protein HYU52_08275 [Acidobacteria bacterium]|nr:hypothetical protein [Acidobacteriota bacterium]
MKTLMTIGAVALFLLTAIPAAAESTPFDDAVAKTADELIKDIETQHPMIYFVLAGKLYDAGRKEEATFWLYAGQLRYRFHIEAHPEPDPAKDKEVFAAMTQQIGGPINQWAFGDIAMLEKTLADVLAWDEKSPNAITSKKDFAETWQKTRTGMKGYSAYIHDNAEQIRAQRSKNGWENRN